jgi:sorbitol-specific phosphotransferase system component IIBC
MLLAKMPGKSMQWVYNECFTTQMCGCFGSAQFDSVRLSSTKKINPKNHYIMTRIEKIARFPEQIQALARRAAAVAAKAGQARSNQVKPIRLVKLPDKTYAKTLK